MDDVLKEELLDTVYQHEKVLSDLAKLQSDLEKQERAAQEKEALWKQVLQKEEELRKMVERDSLRDKGLFTSRGVVERLFSRAHQELFPHLSPRKVNNTVVAKELDKLAKSGGLLMY